MIHTFAAAWYVHLINHVLIGYFPSFNISGSYYKMDVTEFFTLLSKICRSFNSGKRYQFRITSWNVMDTYGVLWQYLMNESSGSEILAIIPEDVRCKVLVKKLRKIKENLKISDGSNITFKMTMKRVNSIAKYTNTCTSFRDYYIPISL